MANFPLLDILTMLKDGISRALRIKGEVDVISSPIGETLIEQKTNADATYIPEVASLNITSTPTNSGNITVTLDGTATDIAVTAGVAEVASLTITAIPTLAGDVTITLNGVVTTVAVDPTTETTTDLVASIIRDTTFTGWTTSGTGSVVIFTSTTVGVKTDSIYSEGATGATGTMSTTTQGVDADTTITIATKIRETTFSGWTTGGTAGTTTVTFTATTSGSKIDAIYSAGTTGVTGTMTTTTQGTDSKLTFSENITAIEIYHEESDWQNFIVNGITLTIPAGSYRSLIEGIPNTEVIIPDGINCIVGRLV